MLNGESWDKRYGLLYKRTRKWNSTRTSFLHTKWTLNVLWTLETCAKNGEYGFLWWVSSVAKRECTHRQTGWGLHQCGWSNDACVTPQRWPCHELAWIWTDFLSEQRWATGLVETAGGVARAGDKQQPARCSRKTQDKFAIASMAKKLLHRCICVHARAHMHFLRRVWCAFQQVLWAPCMCRCVRQTGVVNISVHLCLHARYRMCIRARLHAVWSFIVGERGCGGSASPWKHLLLGVGGKLWQKER